MWLSVQINNIFQNHVSFRKIFGSDRSSRSHKVCLSVCVKVFFLHLSWLKQSSSGLEVVCRQSLSSFIALFKSSKFKVIQSEPKILSLDFPDWNCKLSEIKCISLSLFYRKEESLWIPCEPPYFTLDLAISCFIWLNLEPS